MMNNDPVDVMKYALDSLDILGTSARLAGGQPHFYRVAAVQLRMLLCDSTRRHNQTMDISLIPGLLPELSLPMVTADGNPDPRGENVGLAAWLEQIPIRGSGLTLRQMIRITCDQDGGAHVDSRKVDQHTDGMAAFLVTLATWLVPLLSDLLKR